MTSECTSSGVLKGIVGGWQVSTIVSARSGTVLLVTQPSGIANSRPDVVAGVDPVLSDWRDTLRYLNRNAFALVPTSSVTTATLRPGNVPPDYARGPASWTVDLTLAKNIRLHAANRVQLRADVFNVLNHVNLNNPNTTVTSPDFGRITAAATMRTGQVGVRMTF